MILTFEDSGPQRFVEHSNSLEKLRSCLILAAKIRVLARESVEVLTEFIHFLLVRRFTANKVNKVVLRLCEECENTLALL